MPRIGRSSHYRKRAQGSAGDLLPRSTGFALPSLAARGLVTCFCLANVVCHVPETDVTFGSSESSPATSGPEPTTSDSDGSSSTFSHVCGNGIVEPPEACDDGNDIQTDSCLDNCTLAACGDGFVHAGVEACDDGNDIDTDTCLSTCEAACCGDGVTWDGVEGCDDGNNVHTDSCLNTCQPNVCGDGIRNEGVEACDDGINSGEYGGCATDCSMLMPRCGDGIVQSEYGERCDGETGFDQVLCNSQCQFDLSNVPQLFCREICTWNESFGCDQGDADIFCKLLTGDPDAYAESYEITTTLDRPGFACANESVFLDDGMGNEVRENIAPLPGLDRDVIFYQSGSLKETHGVDQDWEKDVIVFPTCVPLVEG